jgi:hypothetical protein
MRRLWMRGICATSRTTIDSSGGCRLRDPNSALTDILDFDLVPAHAGGPEDRHLVGELIDQCRLRAVPELHFAAGFDLIGDLFKHVASVWCSAFFRVPAHERSAWLTSRNR